MDQSVNHSVEGNRFPREVTDGVFWLNRCIPTLIFGRILHVHLSIYLVKGQDKTLLVDTSLPTYWSDIEGQLEDALAGRTLDYLFVTHPEVPHAGAMPLLLEKYPDLKVVGDVRDYQVFFPDYSSRFVDMRPGEKIDLGGRNFRFIDAVIKDLPNSLWGYDELTRAMFVSDGFSFSHESANIDEDRADPISSSLQNVSFSVDEDDAPSHRPGECCLMSSELPTEVSIEQASVVLQRALTFSRFVYPQPLFKEVDQVLRDNPPKLICPAHGSVIDNIEALLPVIRQTHDVAFASGAGARTK